MNRKLCLACVALAVAGMAAAGPLGAGGVVYDSKGKRDPFTPIAGQQKKAGGVLTLEEVASVEDLKLEGIAVGRKGARVAMLNGSMLKEGDKAGVVEVRKVTKNNVLVAIDSKEYTLSLQEDQ